MSFATLPAYGELAFGGLDGTKKKCPQCEKQGLKSKVYPVGSSTTLIAPSHGYWDEDGNWHDPGPDPNTTTYTYRCSNGHTWTESF